MVRSQIDELAANLYRSYSARIGAEELKSVIIRSQRLNRCEKGVSGGCIVYLRCLCGREGWERFMRWEYNRRQMVISAGG